MIIYLKNSFKKRKEEEEEITNDIDNCGNGAKKMNKSTKDANEIVVDMPLPHSHTHIHKHTIKELFLLILCIWEQHFIVKDWEKNQKNERMKGEKNTEKKNWRNINIIFKIWMVHAAAKNAWKK